MLLVIISVPVTAVTVVPPCPTLSRTYPAKEAAPSRIHATRNSRARIPRHGCINEANSNPLRGTHGPSWSRGESGGSVARGSRVNGLHCTFKRPSLLRLSPFRVLHYPRAVLRDYSAMTNECPVLRGSHTPSSTMSLICNNSSRELPTPRSRGNMLLIFIFRKTNWRRTRRINNGGEKRPGEVCVRWVYVTRVTKPLPQLSIISALWSFDGGKL